MNQRSSQRRPVAMLALNSLAAVIGAIWLLCLAITYASTDANVNSKAELLELAAKTTGDSSSSAGAQADLIVMFNGFSIARKLLAITMLPLALLTFVSAASAIRAIRASRRS